MIIIKVEKRHYEMDLESVLKKWQKYYEGLFGKGNVVALPADHQIERIEIGDNLSDIRYSPYDTGEHETDPEDIPVDGEIDTSVGRRYKHRNTSTNSRPPTPEETQRRECLIKDGKKYRDYIKSQTPIELNHNFINNLRKDLMPEDNPMKDALK